MIFIRYVYGSFRRCTIWAHFSLQVPQHLNTLVSFRDYNSKNLITLPYHHVLISLIDENSKIINIGLMFSIDLEKEYFLIFSDLKYAEQLETKKVLIGCLRSITKDNHQGYLYL